jgi:type IX secretion system PorP/SprF family membrane protein
MKKTLTIIALSVTGFAAYAQQDAQFSMNMFNKLAINPGYTGTNKALCATVLYRDQWDKFPGAPKTGLLSVDYGRILGGGLGITVDQDILGFDKTLKAKLSYAYHLPIAGTGTLGIGLDAGMIQKSLSGDFVAPDGTTSSTGGGTDNAIPWSGSSATTYDIGFGLYFTNNNLYVGLSSLHLAGPAQTLSASGGAGSLAYDFKYEMARHYYVMAGYHFRAKDWTITPSILTKSDASSTQLDINLMAKYRNMIFAGVSYRLTDAMVAMVGLDYPLSPKSTLKFGYLKFGYAYDITLSNIKTYNKGTHEVMLGYCQKFATEPKPTSHMNVRFL